MTAARFPPQKDIFGDDDEMDMFNDAAAAPAGSLSYHVICK